MQKEILGRESILKLHLNGKILFFTQRALFEKFSNILNLQLRNCNISFYFEMTENPKREEIQKAQNFFAEESFDAIIAFGGGSVIDFAKAFRFFDRRFQTKLIAVPTTAGTGSEATQFSVVYENGNKTSLDDSLVLPDIALVDSQFSESAPIKVKASCAFDAYCQAIESFWAKKATLTSRRYSLQAINLCRMYLREAVLSEDIFANEQMALAAHLAGKAINISRTTAAHALSYKITSRYGIPHGHAVALSLPGLFKINLPAMEKAERETLLTALGLQNPKEFSFYFWKLMQDVGLENKISKLGITDIEDIVDSVNVDRLKNNVRDLTRQELKEILSLNEEEEG